MSIKLIEDNPVNDYVLKVRDRMEKEGINPSKYGAYICLFQIHHLEIKIKAGANAKRYVMALANSAGLQRRGIDVGLDAHGAEKYYTTLVSIESKLLPTQLKSKLGPCMKTAEFTYKNELLDYVLKRIDKLSHILELNIYGDTRQNMVPRNGISDRRLEKDSKENIFSTIVGYGGALILFVIFAAIAWLIVVQYI